MTDSYTIIYELDGILRPHTHTVIHEEEAIRFASKHPGSRIRRDSDGAYFDSRSGDFVRIIQHE